MDYCARFKVGVFGSADGDLDELNCRAWAIGEEIAKRSGILITGACPGLPHQTALGAASKGGLVLGFSPAMNLSDHVNKFHFPENPYTLICTGLEKKGRNIISVRSCDAAIFISGRIGTLNELTLFWDEASHFNVMGILTCSGGVVDGVFPFLVNITAQEKPSRATIVLESDPVSLVEEVFQVLEELKNSK